jgi:hypothetical protein
MLEKIKNQNISKLQQTNCFITKVKKTYYLVIEGTKFKLPSKWKLELQINLYNEHFQPEWLLNEPEAGEAMMLQLKLK